MEIHKVIAYCWNKGVIVNFELEGTKYRINVTIDNVKTIGDKLFTAKELDDKVKKVYMFYYEKLVESNT